MLNFLNKIHSKSFNSFFLFNQLKINSILRHGVEYIANVVLPISLKGEKKYGLSSIKREIPVIVSLTSFPKRIPKLWMVIETIFQQTVKVDKIILYLSKEQFPLEEENLPNSLLAQKQRGLEIIFVEGDIRSHKKYYYSIKMFPNSNIFIIDDDIFYPTDMVETMLDAHNHYPDRIICRYAKSITYEDDGNLASIYSWKHIYNTSINDSDVFFGTGGGTLIPYPYKSLYKDTLNLDLAIQLCPTEDDLWINTMAKINSTQIVVVKDYKGILPVITKDDVMLFGENGEAGGKTNNQLLKVIRYYKSKGIFPYQK